MPRRRGGDLPCSTHLGGSGFRPIASQEFIVTPIAEPQMVVAKMDDPNLRSALALHRCRLDVLRDAGVDESQRLLSQRVQWGQRDVDSPSAALTSFALYRRRVRIVGPDDAAIRRCRRLLAARFPMFAFRNAVMARTRENSGGRRQDRTDVRGLFNNPLNYISASGFNQQQQKQQLQQQQQQHWSSKFSLYNRIPALQNSTIAMNRRPHPLVAIDDGYSAFFTESSVAQSPNTHSLHRESPCAADTTSFKSSYTCATVTLSVDRTERPTIGSRRLMVNTCGAIGSGDAKEPKRQASQSRAVAQLKLTINCGSDERANAPIQRRLSPLKVADMCVQTTPSLLAGSNSSCNSCSLRMEPPPRSIARVTWLSEEKFETPSYDSLIADIRNDASMTVACGSDGSNTPVIIKPHDGIQLSSAREELAPRRPRRTLQHAAGVSQRCSRGKLAHKRVTWYLCWTKRRRQA